MTKKINLITILTIMILSFAVASEGSFAVDAIENEYIVRISDSSAISSMNSKGQDAQSKNDYFISAMQDSGLDVRDSFIEEVPSSEFRSMTNDEDFGELIASEIGFVFLVKSNSIDELEERLLSSGLYPDVIEPNYSLKSTSRQESISTYSNTISSNQRESYSLINLVEAWNITTGSPDVRVAVLDTGIDSNHSGLSAFIDTSLGRNFTSKGSSTDFFDREGHGTHVAGVISSSGATSGVMKESSIIPLKVLDENGNGNTFDLEKAILYSIKIDVDVINMSLGGPNKSSSLERTVQLAHDEGLIMVASAGNDGKGNLYYPARFEPVISVGSVSVDGVRSSFSNYGEGLDIMAPGENIYSTLPRNRYGLESGTSSSAPHVAGVIGLAKSVNPNLTTDDIRYMLQENSNFTKEYGFGVIDAKVFLDNIIYTRMGLEDASLFGSETIYDSTKSWNVSFNLDLDPETINSDTIYIIDSRDRVFPTEIVPAEKSILLSPLKAYDTFENYRIYISKDIKSISKSPLKNNFRFDFTVRDAT